MAGKVFPNHYINPKDKLKDSTWILEMDKAIWDEFDSQSIKSFNKGGNRYNLNTLYALGKQPSDIYKPMFEISDDEDSSYMNLDFSPPPIIPKFKRITLNRFAKAMDDFRVSAEAIDALALDDKNNYEAEERANIKMREMLSQLGMPSNRFDTGEVDQPMDEQELAIKLTFGWKHDDAIQIEKSIDAVFSHERLADKASEMRNFGFDTGLLAAKTYTDSITGKVGFRIVDPSNVVVSPTKDAKFGDIWYAGEHKLYTIDQIRRESRGEISERDLEDLAVKNVGKYGNPANFEAIASGAMSYDSCKVPVLDMEFLSEDVKVMETRTDKRGNKVTGYVDHADKKSDRAYTEESKIVVYRSKWVVGTNLIFDWGLKSDMPRKADSDWDTRLSYVFCAPEMNLFETMPIVENLMSITDQITIAWYKLQNVMARARPKGIAIEIGALEDISLGDAAEGTMSPIDLLDMFTKTGNLVYRRINLEGAPSNYKPIEELANGLGSEAAEHFAVIDKYMAMIRDMIGFNDFTDGSTPDPKALNGVGQMAVEGTNNALHHLLEAERFVIERIAEDIAIRVHDSIVYKKNSPYRNIVVGNGERSINSYDGTMERVFNIVLDYGSDKQEKMNMNRMIEQSHVNKEITLADVIAIKRIRNIKQAELLLAYRIKKNIDAQRESMDADKRSNAEASIMAANAAEEQKRLTLEAEASAKIAEIKAQGEVDASLLILEMTLKGQNEIPKLATKEKIAELANQHKENMERFKSASKTA